MPYADNTFDHCISLLMRNFLADYREAAAEMVRVTRIGGIVGAAGVGFGRRSPGASNVLRHSRGARSGGGFPQGLFQALQQRGELAALWAENGLMSVKEIALNDLDGIP